MTVVQNVAVPTALQIETLVPRDTAVVRLGGPHAEAEVEVAGLLAMSISWSSVLGGFGDLASTAAIFPT